MEGRSEAETGEAFLDGVRARFQNRRTGDSAVVVLTGKDITTTDRGALNVQRIIQKDRGRGENAYLRLFGPPSRHASAFGHSRYPIPR